MINFHQDREKLNNLLNKSADILKIDFKIAGINASIFLVDGLSDKQLLDRNIIEPLKKLRYLDAPILESLGKAIFISDPIKVAENLDKAAMSVADGDIVLLIDGADNGYILSVRDYKTRAITEPPVSLVLRGPREGFVEDMKTNMTLIRRRLRTPKFVAEQMKIGKYTETNVSICYIEGVCEPKIAAEIKKRLQAIEIDGIIDTSYLARFLEDNKYSIFNQAGTSEKPDIIAAKLLEGRVAIVADGSPTVLTLPFVMFEHFQASSDYFIKSYRATTTRLLRVLAMVIAIALPAAYVALQEFQYQLLPLKLLIVIMNSMNGIPLTPTLEMLLLLIIFEVLNETSVRMPRYVGTALSIVGAIVLGEAAVNAGLLSVPAVLVTAISTIGLYGVPDEVDSASLLRMLFVFVAGVLGMFGLILAMVVLTVYLVGMKSFGTSYLAPFAPLLYNDLQDALIKQNITEIKKRPYSIPTKNRTRQINGK